MDPKETQEQRVTRVALEIGTEIRRQVRGKWKVRTAERNERGRHVWRFKPASEDGERFLHIEHRAMAKGSDSTARLLEQLESERWLDRLQNGPETALLLSSDGRVSSFPKG
jgi:hypothetical protein